DYSCQVWDDSRDHPIF
nr:immunoglobulin light chain junction region [Macaca mulatta]